jgi:hypothetical protein
MHAVITHRSATSVRLTAAAEASRDALAQCSGGGGTVPKGMSELANHAGKHDSLLKGLQSK